MLNGQVRSEMYSHRARQGPVVLSSIPGNFVRLQGWFPSLRIPGLRLGSRGSDCRASMGEGRPTQKREGATRARASLPRNRPRLGHRPQAAVAQLLLPPSPTPSGEALVAAVLRRPQAETGTPDGCFAGESPRARQRTTPVPPAPRGPRAPRLWAPGGAIRPAQSRHLRGPHLLMGRSG